MPGQPASSSKSESALGRIRDNQRRSRARRKEYLQELENKFRKCEQLGVEASAEMQAAARRVLEENQRLRQMLKKRGVSDAELDNAGVSAAVGAGRLPPQVKAEEAEDETTLSPVGNLERLLTTRKRCVGEGESGSFATEGIGNLRASSSSATSTFEEQPERQPDSRTSSAASSSLQLSQLQLQGQPGQAPQFHTPSSEHSQQRRMYSQYDYPTYGPATQAPPPQQSHLIRQGSGGISLSIPPEAYMPHMRMHLHATKPKPSLSTPPSYHGQGPSPSQLHSQPSLLPSQPSQPSQPSYTPQLLQSQPQMYHPQPSPYTYSLTHVTPSTYEQHPSIQALSTQLYDIGDLPGNSFDDLANEDDLLDEHTQAQLMRGSGGVEGGRQR